MSEENKKQFGGSYYKNKAIQPWDYILANNIPFMEGSIIEYLTRWREKGGLQDLQKAKHFLDKLIEWETTHSLEQKDI